MEQPKLVICLPLQRGQLESECLDSLMAARRHLYKHGIHHNLLTSECSLIFASRNSMSEVFLNNTKGNLLFWLDSDMSFPPYGIKRLIDRDKDIIGGVYYRKTATAHPLVLDFEEGGRFKTKMEFPLDRPFECDAIGTGFMLVKRRVLEKFTADVVKELGTPFGIGSAPDGIQEGEDLSFCRRAKKLGFQVWADPTIPLGHVGKYVYTRQTFLSKQLFTDWMKTKAAYKNEIEGWMTVPELNWLHDTAKEMNGIVEVGSWKGRSTHALLTGSKGPVMAVDTFEGSKPEMEGPHVEAKEGHIYDDFMKNVGNFPNLNVMKMESLKAAAEMPDRSVDMVFIDGDHSYDAIKADIKAWMPKAKKMICGHDFQWHSVQEAVTEAFGEVDTFETIWVKRLEDGSDIVPP